MDATAVPRDRGGVGRYLDALLPPLQRLVADGRGRLVVACQPRDVGTFAALVPGAGLVAAPAATARRPVRLAWEQSGLPLLARGSEVLLSPHYTMPLLAAVPVVVTLHDATFFTDPALHLPGKARFFRTATRVAVRRAAACVVPSQATLDEVVRAAGGDPGRLRVAHHGVDPAVFHPPSASEVDRLAAALGVRPGRYVAFLGTIEPRKNVPALVAGWVAAVRDLPNPPALVLAGARGWERELGAAVAAVPPHLRVLTPGYLPLADLRALLGGAAVVAYPSLGEGFGLPVLEAMASGAAVLTTRRLALPEVGGDAVAYCGTDPAEIAVALADLLADPDRCAALGRAARDRAAGFTWEASARLHAEVLGDVARAARR